jgi:hypothetical protein
MLTLTPFEAAVLAGGVLAALLLLVGGVLRTFPRATTVVPTTVVCPLRHRRAQAELLRDAWTLRFVGVARCSVLSGYGTVICSKRCLAGDAAGTLPRAA